MNEIFEGSWNREGQTRYEVPNGAMWKFSGREEPETRRISVTWLPITDFIAADCVITYVKHTERKLLVAQLVKISSHFVQLEGSLLILVTILSQINPPFHPLMLNPQVKIEIKDPF